MRPADKAWLAILGGGAVYEAVAFIRRDWELLSAAFDRYRAAFPLLVPAAVVYLGLHLLRAIPAQADPLGRLADGLTALRRT